MKIRRENFVEYEEEKRKENYDEKRREKLVEYEEEVKEGERRRRKIEKRKKLNTREKGKKDNGSYSRSI